LTLILPKSPETVSNPPSPPPNTVGSAGTRQPTAAARRSQAQACRRANPAHDSGVHLRPCLRPANSLSAVRVRGRRAVVWGAGTRDEIRVHMLTDTSTSDTNKEYAEMPAFDEGARDFMGRAI